MFAFFIVESFTLAFEPTLAIDFAHSTKNHKQYYFSVYIRAIQTPAEVDKWSLSFGTDSDNRYNERR